MTSPIPEDVLRMAREPVLLLAERRCGQCLTTRRRIVSSQRAAEIVRGCRQNGHHFQCHKGSAVGLNLHCRGVHDLAGSQAHRFAVAAGIEVRMIAADALSRGEHLRGRGNV